MTVRKMKRWLVKASHKETEESAQTAEISEKLGLCLPTSQLLVNRGCKDAQSAADFLEKKTEQLHDPFLMLGMEKAAGRIAKALADNEKIIIYGDYDVDGVTSVSILHMYLTEHGGDVGYYIPSRLGEGYGMSEASLTKLAAEGCRLIVTVDTGITASDEAKIIKQLGMELIVTDHHECHSNLPEALAVVNPKQPDCPYPFKELAGVGVVFKLLCALEKTLCPEDSLYDCVKRICESCLDLVAIGTVADVMPLRDENRLIVSRGLQMAEEHPRVSLAELLDASAGESKSTVQKRKITSGYIGYTIAPRVNAAGRIRSASIAVELFLSKDREKARELASQLCEINKERQVEENKIIEQAYEKIDAEHDFEHDPVIVLSDENWHHGIIGIVASRITEKYGRPSILISFDDVGDGSGEVSGEGGDIGKGSGRSIKGMNLVDALTHCKDLLVKYGGHELAAGLTIERGNLEAFKQRINDFARGCFDSKQPTPAIEAECELLPREVTMNQALELYKLEPFGVSNPVPVFVMYNLRVSHITPVGGGKHAKLTLTRDTLIITAMYFRHSPAELDIYEGDTVDAMFNLDINEYQNNKTLQFILRDLRLDEKTRAEEENEHNICAAISDGTFDTKNLTSAEIASIIPQRSDFAALYNLLKKELRQEHDTFSIRALCRLLAGAGMPQRYVKVKYIIRVFQEMNILGVDEIESGKEIYRFKYIYVKNKADLDKSNILRRLRVAFLQKS